MDIGIKKTVTLQLFDVGHALNSRHLYRVGQLVVWFFPFDVVGKSEGTFWPGGSEIKNPPAMQRHRFNPQVGKIPWRRKWQPTPVFLPGESYRQSLMGYSPGDHK